MLLAIALAGIVALVLLIAVARLTPFLAFLIVCIGVGLASGLGPLQVSAAIQKGLGDTLGSLLLVIGLGAMLGKIVAESGAAQRIATSLMRISGPSPRPVGADDHGLHRRTAAVLFRRFRAGDPADLQCGRPVPPAACLGGTADAGRAVGHPRLPAAAPRAGGARPAVPRRHGAHAPVWLAHRHTSHHPGRARLHAVHAPDRSAAAVDIRSRPA